MFTDPDVIHVDGDDRRRRGDIETVNTELILADLQTVETGWSRLAKEIAQARRAGPPADAAAERPRQLLDCRHHRCSPARPASSTWPTCATCTC